MRESTFTLVYWGFIPSFPTKGQLVFLVRQFFFEKRRNICGFSILNGMVWHCFLVGAEVFGKGKWKGCNSPFSNVILIMKFLISNDYIVIQWFGHPLFQVVTQLQGVPLVSKIHASSVPHEFSHLFQLPSTFCGDFFLWKIKIQFTEVRDILPSRERLHIPPNGKAGTSLTQTCLVSVGILVIVARRLEILKFPTIFREKSGSANPQLVPRWKAPLYAILPPWDGTLVDNTDEVRFPTRRSKNPLGHVDPKALQTAVLTIFFFCFSLFFFFCFGNVWIVDF